MIAAVSVVVLIGIIRTFPIGAISILNPRSIGWFMLAGHANHSHNATKIQVFYCFVRYLCFPTG
jgi:hypothetical protein